MFTGAIDALAMLTGPVAHRTPIGRPRATPGRAQPPTAKSMAASANLNKAPVRRKVNDVDRRDGMKTLRCLIFESGASLWLGKRT